jgi:hypothetical protein
MVLVCNAPEEARRLIDKLRDVSLEARRAERMRARPVALRPDVAAARQRVLGVA